MSKATERKNASRPATDKPSEPFLENLITYADAAKAWNERMVKEWEGTGPTEHFAKHNAASWKTAADLARKHKEREREQEREPERRTAALETPKGVTITITADDSASADLITVLQKLAHAAAKMIEDGTLGDDD